MGRLSVAAATALISAAGCVLDEVDLAGHACPCGIGWVCDDARGICVRGAGGPSDAGGLDARVPDGGSPLDPDAAGPDAGPIDAGPGIDARSGVDSGPGIDAGAIDAGAIDAGPPDAGSPDAGPPDAGVLDPTACDDVYAGALFCDGFEDSALSAWGWRNEVSGVVTRTTARAYRGSASLRATTSAASGKASIGGNYTTVASGDLWFRAYVYIPSGYTIHTVSLVTVAEAITPWDGSALQATSLDRAHIWVGPEATAYTSTNTVPRDRWFCYRGHLLLSNTAGVVEAWVDGTRVVRQTGIDTLPVAGMTNVVVGVEWSSSGQTSSEVYIDEVVVDDAEVRCD